MVSSSEVVYSTVGEAVTVADDSVNASEVIGVADVLVDASIVVASSVVITVVCSAG